MAFWIPMAISAAGSVIGAANSRKQNTVQAQWNNYNANMQYGVDMTNAAMSMGAAKMNAAAALRAGSMNAQNAVAQAEFNIEQILATSMYNDALMEEELMVMWDQAELDLLQLGNQRAREAGAILVGQAASGTIIDQDSNLDVMIDQKTQEAMDAFIVRHGADVQAANINNARSKGLYEGEMAIVRTKYEGQVAAWQASSDARAQAAGVMGNAQLQGVADMFNAEMRLKSGYAGASMTFGQNAGQINNTMLSGLFSAASSYASSAYKYKTPTTPNLNSSPSNTGFEYSEIPTDESYSRGSGGVNFNRGGTGGWNPGSSMIGGGSYALG